MRLSVLLTPVALTLGLVAAAHAAPIDRIVAVVNDGVVLQSELERSLQMARQQLAERKIAPPPEEVLREQVLDRLILTRVQTQRAQEAGIRVDDRELNDVLAGIAQQNKMTLAQFAVEVRKQGMDYLSLREQIRDEVVIQRLRAREIEHRVLVTDQDINLFLANQAQLDTSEYRLSHILIAVPDGASGEARAKARARAEALLRRVEAGEDFAQLATANSDGQQALQGGDLDWRPGANLPELFANAVQGLKKGQVAPLLENASGFHILKLTDQRGGQERKTITETRAAHILLTPNALRNEEQTKQEIRQIHDRIVKGEDLGEIAKKVSDDPGSKVGGGDLGWQPAGVYAPEFEEAMDKLQPGQLSPPFRSPFGWHVVKVLERRSRDTTDETRRARARAAIQNRKSAEEYDMWLRRLRAEAYVEIRLDKSGEKKAAS
jgi:peptidyl-prolyl cis-trans isomerase SurA